MVIKTACSSSLVALHEACRALNSGDATSAVVAGTNLLLGPGNFVMISSEGILSPEGSCKSFDASADGYARGEGVTAVYIKRLEDALRDGNPVRAVIRATGTNHDGKSQGIFNPRSETQEILMKKVYADAGLSPSDTAFVEVRDSLFRKSVFSERLTGYDESSVMVRVLQLEIPLKLPLLGMCLETVASISAQSSQTLGKDFED